ncbi:polysaccharide deacetylase family protein [Bosea sp. (in: a-proteobacteria)]|jgi:hypothetical protein|uniref:polysaccharide deacetylase family protein n=1 Tax=Bosea sp. (in: a-proteobacteria) TaxID=1871050 RepID=UPI003F6E4C8F
MNDATWDPLLAELDRWRIEGRHLRLWLRDDDAIAPGPQLDRLAALADRFDAPVLLAVIPHLAEPALVPRLTRAPLLLPCQHGSRHRNHAPEGEKKAEFGRHRPLAAMLDEIATARRRLDDLFGPALLPVFVPPWNRIDREVTAALPDLGFTGLSCFRGFTLGERGGPALVNSEIDIIDWHGGRIGRSAPAIVNELTALLVARREKGEPDDRIGLLLHHRDHDEAAWALLDALLARLASHPAIRLADPRQLFSGTIAA